MLDNLAEEIAIKSPDDAAKFKKFCEEMGMWEGRHAAMMWLIEFIGVVSSEAGSPIESNRRKGRKNHAFDVDVMDLPGGEYFDLHDKNATLLAEVWKGCKQATAHATFGSGHKSLARDRLTQGLLIVRAHLERTVYKKAGLQVRL